LPGGTKNWEWIKKGAPIRVEIGPRDIEKGSVAVARRDQSPKDRSFPTSNEFIAEAPALLESIQQGLLERASRFRREHTARIDTESAFREFFTPRNAGKPEIHGGFALCHWAGDAADEDRLREDLKVTIRCIPSGDEFAEAGRCFLTGRPSTRRVVFAKSY
jgi:prolyl-tRNA synthetase